METVAEVIGVKGYSSCPAFADNTLRPVTCLSCTYHSVVWSVISRLQRPGNGSPGPVSPLLLNICQDKAKMLKVQALRKYSLLLLPTAHPRWANTVVFTSWSFRSRMFAVMFCNWSTLVWWEPKLKALLNQETPDPLTPPTPTPTP